jgi:hypothetical protein
MNVKHYKITCWFELDILPRKMKNTVEFNSAMDQKYFVIPVIKLKSLPLGRNLLY